MKTILLALAHYGSNNRQHLLRCLEEYNSYEKYDITVHLYLTEDIDCSSFSKLRIRKHLFPTSIGQQLVQQHKILFHDERGKYDYYVYCEDDVMITEDNFDTYVVTQESLPLPYVCGFMRYEYKEDSSYKYLFDNHPVHSVHRGGTTVIKSNYVINGESYFEVYNIHQGCYLLTRDALEIAINSNRYLERTNHYAGGPLEGAASDPYYKCGLIKVIPRNKISKLIVPHMAHRYVKMLPEIYTEVTTPDDVKMATLKLEMTPIYV